MVNEMVNKTTLDRDSRKRRHSSRVVTPRRKRVSSAASDSSSDSDDSGNSFQETDYSDHEQKMDEDEEIVELNEHFSVHVSTSTTLSGGEISEVRETANRKNNLDASDLSSGLSGDFEFSVDSCKALLEFLSDYSEDEC